MKIFIQFFTELGFKMEVGKFLTKGRLATSPLSWIEVSFDKNQLLSVNWMDEGDRCPIIALQKIESINELKEHLKKSHNLFFDKDLYDLFVNHSSIS